MASIWNEVDQMKKRVTSLLLTLVMALALFPAAVAAENTNPLLVSGLAQGQTGFLAGYNDQGRMVGLRMLTADGEVAAIPGATSLKFIRTDGSYAPQGPAFSLSQNQGTVRKVDGQVRVCYDGPDGLRVSQAVTEKMTGMVATCIPSTGQLNINGEKYSATKLSVEGCEYTVTKDGFRDWPRQPGFPFWDTLDLYLDSAGNICWVELVKAYVHPAYVCLILSVSVTGSTDGEATIQAQMMYPFGTEELTVSILNGEPITDPDAAVAQLSASAPGGLYACQLQRDGGYSLTPVDNAAGSGWGQTVRLPYDIPVYPQEDFTLGAVSCAADDNTRFYVVQDDPKEGSVSRIYDTFGSLPTRVVLDGYIVTDEADPTVARFVYLHIAADPPPLPNGYVFLPSTGWHADPELYEDDIFLVDIVDTDGTQGRMRVSDALRRAIAADRMVLGSYWGNALVGRFCAVTEIDEYRVVSDLEPAAAVNVQSIEDGVISLADGVTYGYGSDTKFIYVDMMWADDQDDPANKIGVREPSRDKWVLAETGIIHDPDTFFNAADVDATGAYSDSVEDQNPNGATYISVRAAVIPEKDEPALADWVYVVRELW